MKWKITLALLVFVTISLAQELPTNPQTGLVSIKDSIDIKNKSIQEIKEMMSKWSYTLIDKENLAKIYSLNNSKQTENIYVSLPLYSVLNQQSGNNKFQTNGTLTYNKVKTSGLNAVAPLVVSGGIKYNFTYTITSKKLIYEFTNLEYSHDGLHFGKFEDSKPPADNLNRSLIIKMGKKEWGAVKEEYFTYLKTLASNLKEYSTSILQETHSPISYESYKKISVGMTYNEVVKLLDDEGKEVSNSSTQLNGKLVSQQTIIWNDLDKTKSITVSFVDGKVVSKAQSNL